MLGFEIAVAVLRAMNGLNTSGSFIGPFEGDVDSQGLMLTIGAFPITDGDLLDIPVLAKKLWLA